MATPTPPSAPVWLPYMGFLLAVGGIIYQGGQLSSQVSQDAARITRLEAAMAASTQQINDMNLRGERSAAKLDFLVENAKREHK
jgi:hypothetical protein